MREPVLRAWRVPHRLLQVPRRLVRIRLLAARGRPAPRARYTIYKSIINHCAHGFIAGFAGVLANLPFYSAFCCRMPLLATVGSVREDAWMAFQSEQCSAVLRDTQGAEQQGRTADGLPTAAILYTRSNLPRRRPARGRSARDDQQNNGTCEMKRKTHSPRCRPARDGAPVAQPACGDAAGGGGPPCGENAQAAAHLRARAAGGLQHPHAAVSCAAQVLRAQVKVAGATWNHRRQYACTYRLPADVIPQAVEACSVTAA